MKQFGTEQRPGQLAFYQASLDTLNNGGILLAEAPPGVGKTLGYLNAAVANGKFPIIIAVHRRALQDQIIADCRKHFPELKASVIKGHNAYGCGLDLPEWAQGELPKDLTQEQRDKVSSNRCIKVGKCHAKEARVKAWASDIIVCTHTMLCLDQKVRQMTDGVACILPDAKYLIIDEAHTLFWEAINMMSHRISERSFMKQEEEPCIEWLKSKRGKSFHEALDDVDWVIEAVSSRENYLRYKQALSDNSGEEDLAGGSLIQQFGEASFRQILKDYERAVSLIQALETIGHEDYVSWSDKETCVIEVKPKESASLTSKLFQRSAVVACSATLPFKAFRQEHHIPESKAKEITVPSSFDKSKVRVVIKGPHPTKMRFAHKALVKESLQYLAQTMGGDVLVLCASYDMARHAYDSLLNYDSNRPGHCGAVVMQQPGEPLPDFPDGGFLIACESAWAGFDRRGLKAVVITSVPFLVPDPWVNAMLDDKGWNWYNMQARTKLIQGIGRLQRCADDKGLVLILDERAKRLVKAS